MSGAGVFRVHFADSSVIVKARAGANEMWFYREAAPVLTECGVVSPICHWNEAVAGSRWLVLEDIRQSLPRGRWLADPDVLGMLRRLHRIPIAALPPSPAPFRPAWSAELTEAALTLLPPEDVQVAAPKLEAIRDAVQPLLAPTGVISGDPNPANWGVRAHGDLVLFDWERFGFGGPALDLAITVPGLGDAAAFHDVAATYLAPADSRAIDELARALAWAKVWTVVELLAGIAAGVAHPPPGVEDWLVGRLPSWLDEIG